MRDKYQFFSYLCGRKHPPWNGEPERKNNQGTVLGGHEQRRHAAAQSGHWHPVRPTFVAWRLGVGGNVGHLLGHRRQLAEQRIFHRHRQHETASRHRLQRGVLVQHPDECGHLCHFVRSRPTHRVVLQRAETHLTRPFDVPVVPDFIVRHLHQRLHDQEHDEPRNRHCQFRGFGHQRHRGRHVGGFGNGILEYRMAADCQQHRLGARAFLVCRLEAPPVVRLHTHPTHVPIQHEHTGHDDHQYPERQPAHLPLRKNLRAQRHGKLLPSLQVGLDGLQYRWRHVGPGGTTRNGERTR